MSAAALKNRADEALPEHFLATVEDDAAGRSRYVCACGKRGRWVPTIAGVLPAEEWARGAHKIHADMAAAADRGERPEDWGL